MNYRDLCYVDVACGGPFNRNNVQDIRKLKFTGNVDNYRTYFRYPEEFKAHVEKTGSVKKYAGPAYADYFPIDIDCEDLDVALSTAKAFLLELTKEDAAPKTFPLFFSGAKGFHIFIPAKSFGCVPSRKIAQYFKRFAAFLLKPFGVKYDSSIYDLVRIFRANNTINSKSGLYKIQLDINELFALTVEEIRELAKAPREKIATEPAVVSEFLSTLYKRACEEDDACVAVVAEASSVAPPKNAKLCYHEILKGVTEGGRDIIAYRLACHFKRQAFAEDIVLAMLRAWNLRNAPPLDDAQLSEKVKNAFAEGARDDFGCNDETLKQFCSPRCYLRSKAPSSDISIADIKTVVEMEAIYDQYVKHLKERMCRIDLPTIGKAMRGIAPGEVLTILARSGVGKTAILINLLLRIGIVNKFPQLFFTMEQPNAQIFERMAQITMGLSGEQVEKIFDSGEAWDTKATRPEIVSAVKRMYEHVLFVDKDYLTIDQMMETIRIAESERIGKKIGLVAIDYLGRMKSDGRDPYKVLSENAQGMKHMAKELDVAVIVLGQVSRKGGDGTQEIFLDSARDSGQIEEASDFLWGMWRPDMHEKRMEPEERLVISLLKNRKGPAPLTVDMKLVKRCLRVDDIEENNSLWITGGDEPDTQEEMWGDQPW